MSYNNNGFKTSFFILDIKKDAPILTLKKKCEPLLEQPIAENNIQYEHLENENNIDSDSDDSTKDATYSPENLERRSMMVIHASRQMHGV